VTTTTEKIAVTVRLIGGLSAMIEIGGLRLLTDPTVDSLSRIEIGNRTLTRMQPPAVPVDEIGPITAVLVCHDQYGGNMDDSGRQLLPSVPLVMTTVAAAARLGDAARAMPPWYHLSLPRPTAVACGSSAYRRGTARTQPRTPPSRSPGSCCPARTRRSYTSAATMHASTPFEPSPSVADRST
jgi:hypothetical protein